MKRLMNMKHNNQKVTLRLSRCSVSLCRCCFRAHLSFKPLLSPDSMGGNNEAFFHLAYNKYVLMILSCPELVCESGAHDKGILLRLHETAFHAAVHSEREEGMQ